MKDEFLSLIAHELRTPVTAIKGYLDLIPMIMGVVNSLQPGITAKHQTLKLELARRLPRVMGDADRITQLLTNLLSYAHRSTDQDTSIVIRADIDNAHGYVRLYISGAEAASCVGTQQRNPTQNGRASSPADHDMSSSIKLELAIARFLAEMHGGTLTVSETAAPGPSITVLLPALETPKPEGTTNCATEDKTPHTSRCVPAAAQTVASADKATHKGLHLQPINAILGQNSTLLVANSDSSTNSLIVANLSKDSYHNFKVGGDMRAIDHIRRHCLRITVRNARLPRFGKLRLLHSLLANLKACCPHAIVKALGQSALNVYR